MFCETIYARAVCVLNVISEYDISLWFLNWLQKKKSFLLRQHNVISKEVVCFGIYDVLTEWESNFYSVLSALF